FLVSVYREREGLIRAFVLRNHTDAEFRARQERLSHYVNDKLSRLLLARAGEITHPDPPRAAAFGLTMVASAIESIVLFGELRSSDLVLSDDELGDELTRAFLAYLGLPPPPPLIPRAARGEPRAAGPRRRLRAAAADRAALGPPERDLQLGVRRHPQAPDAPLRERQARPVERHRAPRLVDRRRSGERAGARRRHRHLRNADLGEAHGAREAQAAPRGDHLAALSVPPRRAGGPARDRADRRLGPLVRGQAVRGDAGHGRGPSRRGVSALRAGEAPARVSGESRAQEAARPDPRRLALGHE